MCDIKSWMDAERLKMNNSKTEFIYSGGPRQIEKNVLSKIYVNGEQIPRSQMTIFQSLF